MGSSSEKVSLPTSAPQAGARQSSKWPKRVWAALCLSIALVTLGQSSNVVRDGVDYLTDLVTEDEDFKSAACQQADPVLPQSFDVSSLVNGQDNRIIEWLGGAVRVPTEIFDVMGPIGEDERWEVFYKFADYLEEAFPLVHQHLKRTRVVTHALIFEWEGSDPSLKPLLLTGHQDVVPVLPDTRGLWTHDPYGGEYEEESGRIWGRGASDDKSGVIGFLSAIELLLESGKFSPTRTVILALGIDEETGGKVGAYHLGQWIEQKYGKDSIAMLVDEGSGVAELWGQVYGMPAVAEKGYLDVEIKVETLGGHSSVPPEHSGIGYSSLLVAALEKNPHKPIMKADSILMEGMICNANSAPDMPKDLKKAVRKVEKSREKRLDKKALKQVLDWWVKGSSSVSFMPKGMGRAMVTTTQAVDIINGGLKINALPEVVTTVVNHRINIASSVSELQEHLVNTLAPVAEEYNLDMDAFGKPVDIRHCPMAIADGKAGKIILSEAFNSSLNPAPISPYTVDSAAWRLLSGTTKGVFNTRPSSGAQVDAADKTLDMMPSFSTGNTDTKRYWNLTRAIYRFAYQYEEGATKDKTHAHTVDESISAQTFIEEVRWFMNFIVNVDESREV